MKVRSLSLSEISLFSFFSSSTLLSISRDQIFFSSNHRIGFIGRPACDSRFNCLHVFVPPTLLSLYLPPLSLSSSYSKHHPPFLLFSIPASVYCITTNKTSLWFRIRSPYMFEQFSLWWKCVFVTSHTFFLWLLITSFHHSISLWLDTENKKIMKNPFQDALLASFATLFSDQIVVIKVPCLFDVFLSTTIWMERKWDTKLEMTIQRFRESEKERTSRARGLRSNPFSDQWSRKSD